MTILICAILYMISSLKLKINKKKLSEFQGCMLLMSQNRKNIEKIKIYLIKKIKMKIQNKYIFRTITSEFL